MKGRSYITLALLMAAVGQTASAATAAKKQLNDAIIYVPGKQKKQGIHSAPSNHGFCKPATPKNQQQKRERLRSNPALRNKYK